MCWQNIQKCEKKAMVPHLRKKTRSMTTVHLNKKENKKMKRLFYGKVELSGIFASFSFPQNPPPMT
jgi:hypothetical protein